MLKFVVSTNTFKMSEFPDRLSIKHRYLIIAKYSEKDFFSDVLKLILIHALTIYLQRSLHFIFLTFFLDSMDMLVTI